MQLHHYSSAYKNFYQFSLWFIDFLSPYFILFQPEKYKLFKLAVCQIYWPKNGSVTYSINQSASHMHLLFCLTVFINLQFVKPSMP